MGKWSQKRRVPCAEPNTCGIRNRPNLNALRHIWSHKFIKFSESFCQLLPPMCAFRIRSANKTAIYRILCVVPHLTSTHLDLMVWFHLISPLHLWNQSFYFLFFISRMHTHQSVDSPWGERKNSIEFSCFIASSSIHIDRRSHMQPPPTDRHNTCTHLSHSDHNSLSPGLSGKSILYCTRCQWRLAKINYRFFFFYSFCCLVRCRLVIVDEMFRVEYDFSGVWTLAMLSVLFFPAMFFFVFLLFFVSFSVCFCFAKKKQMKKFMTFRSWRCCLVVLYDKQKWCACSLIKVNQWAGVVANWLNLQSAFDGPKVLAHINTKECRI